MSDINYFATVLIAGGIMLGIVIAIFLGPWALVLAILAAFVMTVAVHKFFRGDSA